jgi:hypothetical protein
MIRTLILAAASAALWTSLALADPAVEVTYADHVPWIHLEGDWSASRYQVFRSESVAGPWLALTEGEVLCLGSCFAIDPGAEGGRTYQYRFDLVLPDGRFVSFGPYAVAISPLVRAVSIQPVPNPSRSAARFEVFLRGASLEVDAALFDAQGRRVRTLHRGALPRGTTQLAWDGRDDDGRALGAGLYFARVASPLGVATARVLRVR